MTSGAKVVRFGLMGAVLLLGDRKVGPVALSQVRDIAGKVQLAGLASLGLRETMERSSSEWKTEGKTQFQHIWETGRYLSLLGAVAAGTQLLAGSLPKEWATFVDYAGFAAYSSGSVCWFAHEATRESDQRDGWTLLGATLNLAYALSETNNFVSGNLPGLRSIVGVSHGSYGLASILWPGSGAAGSAGLADPDTAADADGGGGGGGGE